MDYDFTLLRRGIVLTPDMARRSESGGVLNPAVVSDGGTDYLFYRAVDSVPHNYSRIMVARLYDRDGQIEAERLDLCALEPEAAYEKWDDGGGGGCEDPRITRLDDGTFVMAYVAFGAGPGGGALPRIALARSTDLRQWQRLGLIRYAPLTLQGKTGEHVIDMQTVSNKDAALFPERINGRYALLHRPTFPPTVMADVGGSAMIWLSYSDDLVTWSDHQIVLTGQYGWEGLKVGGGTPPLRTCDGWLIVYHGVEGESDFDPNRRYSAGAALLDLADPSRVLYRSPQPILAPDTALERVGVVNNVVFPTGILPRPDGRLHVYYGMADQAIGVAETEHRVL